MKTFGPIHTYEDAVMEAVGQYLELKGKAQQGHIFTTSNLCVNVWR